MSKGHTYTFKKRDREWVLVNRPAGQVGVGRRFYLCHHGVAEELELRRSETRDGARLFFVFTNTPSEHVELGFAIVPDGDSTLGTLAGFNDMMLITSKYGLSPRLFTAVASIRELVKAEVEQGYCYVEVWAEPA